jgi:hypothetical protein
MVSLVRKVPPLSGLAGVIIEVVASPNMRGSTTPLPKVVDDRFDDNPANIE